jgi:hypothetical protein
MSDTVLPNAPIVHVVLFKWKEGASAEQITRVMQALDTLKSKIPGIVDFTCGENFCERSQGYTHGLVARFTDRAALDAYGPHPAHQDVVLTLIRPILESVIAFDFEA